MNYLFSLMKQECHPPERGTNFE